MSNTTESYSQPTFNKKLLASAIAAAIFVLVSLPQTYGQTEKLTHTFGVDNCPTPEGKFIHGALFFAISYFVIKIMSSQRYMGMEGKSDGLIAKYAFYSTLLFFFLANSDSYRLTNRLMGGLSSEAGCPEVKGVIVHGLVFMVIMLLTMYFPRD